MQEMRWRPPKQSGSGDEYESFVSKDKKEGQRRAIPAPAKKSIVVACLLVALGLVCLTMFVCSFFTGSDMNGGKWALPVVGGLSLASGIYTLYLARLIYNETPGYYWSMIFS